jgi:CHAT domain
MFKLIRISIVPVRRAPVRLPITMTVGVPDDDCVDRVEYVFNVPGAINQLAGGAGWERVTRAIQPLVWAPRWDEARLADFVKRLFPNSKRPFPASAVPQVRTYNLLPSASRSGNDTGTREVLHLLASFDALGGEPVLRLGRPSPNEPGAPLSFGAVRDALVSDNTRLLILQVIDLLPTRALEFGGRIVGSGGPATLVVSGGTPAQLDKYFLDLYARLIHNFPLPHAARPSHAGLDAVLFLGKGGEGALQLHRWLDQFRHDLHYLKTADAQLVGGAIGADLSLLHAGQVADLKRFAGRRVTPLTEGEAAAVDAASLDEAAEKIKWAQESKGLLPLSELASMASPVEKMAQRYREIDDPTLVLDLKKKSQEMVAAAPRVLNANFAVPGTKRPLDSNAALRRGRRYDLLVDVGPRWNTIPTLVQGSAAFPEKALPPDKGGHTIRVAFFSEDFAVAGGGRSTAPTKGFSTAVATADLWLPPSGRSHPVIAGRPSRHTGPVRLPVLLQKRGRGRSRSVARGRLSVYYAGNLLQSAVVTVNVSGRTAKRAQRRPNAVTVDYVFSGTFANIGKYERRNVFEANAAPLAVGLNIAMNDDGAGGHRIMVAGHDDPPISRPYDPAANKRLLEKTRLKLRECFAKRDEACLAQGSPDTWTNGLDKDNGKSLAQFKCDLWQMAWQGSDLYSGAFGQLSGPDQIARVQKLKKTLSSRTVIQIARTSAAQYVFPWALVYDIPLPDRFDRGKLNWCPSLKEWDPKGRRTQAPTPACPYQDTSEHKKNMLCPYGFWGLKHVIEQPINVDPTGGAFASGTALTPDVSSQVQWPKPATMSIGLTQDSTLDPKELTAHLTAMTKIATPTPLEGAHTWEQVQMMLTSPDMVYFLCHGEFDVSLDKPYLGIGPRDTNYQHRVYPDLLWQWALTVEGFWSDRHPLVFINGCDTAKLVPDQILSFVNTFSGFGASAVVGTEISIRLPLAVKVAEDFFQRVAAGETIGGAMHGVRWDLANKGNLLGLAYTPYGLSSLRFR